MCVCVWGGGGDCGGQGEDAQEGRNGVAKNREEIRRA